MVKALKPKPAPEPLTTPRDNSSKKGKILE
jgi:hypothetical protein